MSMHAPPPGPHRPAAVLIAGAVLLLVLGGSALVAASRGGGEPVAASQATGVPRTTPATTEALSGSRACERAAQRVLVRYGTDIKSGAPGVVMVTPSESDALDRVPYARDAFLVATTDYTTLVGPWGPDLTVPEAVSRVMPQVRRVCQRAG